VLRLPQGVEGRVGGIRRTAAVVPADCDAGLRRAPAPAGTSTLAATPSTEPVRTLPSSGPAEGEEG
jgi:hypothetical protein